jgi:hypothetical protein
MMEENFSPKDNQSRTHHYLPLRFNFKCRSTSPRHSFGLVINGIIVGLRPSLNFLKKSSLSLNSFFKIFQPAIDVIYLFQQTLCRRHKIVIALNQFITDPHIGNTIICLKGYLWTMYKRNIMLTY